MPACTQCRRLYPRGVTRCPSCGSDLLALVREDEPAIPPAPAERPPGELVVIARCQTRWEADFVRTLLEAEGIATALKPGMSAETWSYLPALNGHIDILVRAEDEEEARDVLLSGRQDAPGE